ncbi:hypothetical protein [Streptosporangium sp. KLBMP 9127]|nr:hypothetical protein [Streptosporangium sp. KLBMP 9127]
MTYLRQTALPATLLILAAACASACSAAPAADAPKKAQAAVPTETGPPPTVEELAAQVGCKPRMQVDAEELRTGYCKTELGRFFLSTFATQQGKDEWMDRAPEYNPHLVGNLWTALADRAVLDRLQAEIGGDLHLKDHRVTPTPSPG